MFDTNMVQNWISCCGVRAQSFEFRDYNKLKEFKKKKKDVRDLGEIDMGQMLPIT